MKLAIITDTHFGGRLDSLHFDQYFKRFYDDVFFPLLDETGIKTILHLGDVFDRRKYVNFQILKSCREYFFDKLESRGIDMHIILGNHDTYYKNTNDVNSIDLLLAGYDNLSVIRSPIQLTFDTLDIQLVPWICADNSEACFDALKNTTAPVCVGHFEIEGFEMHRGMGSESGLDPSEFKKFESVYTGHFHHKSSNRNIHYLGSPYEMTWSDYDDPRGFHILDTKTREMTFVLNPHTMHHKIVYDDSKPIQIQAADYAGAYVKIVVVKKKDFSAFDKLVDALYFNNVAELKILEDFSDFEDSAVGDDVVDIEDTFTLLSEYVDAFETDANRDRLKTVLKTLYVEAQNIEER